MIGDLLNVLIVYGVGGVANSEAVVIAWLAILVVCGRNLSANAAQNRTAPLPKSHRLEGSQRSGPSRRTAADAQQP
jgi:hypothetical protein